MGVDNIVKGNFGQRTTSIEKPENTKDSLEDCMRLFNLLGEQLNSERFSRLDIETQDSLKLQYRMLEVQMFINRLSGYNPTPETITLRRQALKMLPLDSLKSALFNSGQQNWRTQPTLYKAILREIDSREKCSEL